MKRKTLEGTRLEPGWKPACHFRPGGRGAAIARGAAQGFGGAQLGRT
jgi:hypothetical protein